MLRRINLHSALEFDTKTSPYIFCVKAFMNTKVCFFNDLLRVFDMKVL